ncbi:hypothetical protein Tco_1133207 [Tanacetum coccineum]
MEEDPTYESHLDLRLRPCIVSDCANMGMTRLRWGQLHRSWQRSWVTVIEIIPIYQASNLVKGSGSKEKGPSKGPPKLGEGASELDRGVGLRVADSYTGNNREDDFTPLETFRGFPSAFGM